MELTLDEALQKGIEAHKAGKVQEADKYYTAILQANPKHPDANHNMGVLAVGVGKVEEALPFFKTALDANSSIAQYWLSYIDALIKLDREADAKAVFDQAKSNGAKGDGFDEVEKRLNDSNQAQLEARTTAIEGHQDQPNILDTLRLDQALKLAKNKTKEGSLDQAKRIYQDILGKFPQNKRAIGELKGLAGVLFGKASKVQDPLQDQQQSIINLYSQGQLKQALQQATILLQQFPNSSFLYNISGATYKGLGQLDASVEAYKKALSIKPNFARASYNMGNALQMQGKLEEAIEAYKKALSIKPDISEAYVNMGYALKEHGKLDEAIEAYKKAIAIMPDYADAYNNMGIALQEKGKLEEATEAYKKALSIKPDYAEAYKNIAIVLQGIIFSKPNRDFQKTIVSLLDKKTFVRPRGIAKAVISLLKFEPCLQKHLQLVDNGVIENHVDVISDLNKIPLLLKLMSVCPLADLELEKLFKKLRYSILSNISSLKEASPKLLGFQSALALQCFTNEYVYNYSEEEEQNLQALEKIVKKTFKNNQQPSPQIILVLASYKALNQYDWCNLLVVTDDIQEVFSRQVEEPNHEEKLKTQLPILEEITDGISSEVRAQYEESPYPRWVNLGLPLKPMSIPEVVDRINLRLHNSKITEIEAPEILIAGCGTGQHSIQTATRFKSSKVLAIDLSLSSLAYAQRKTEELGIENIEYMQADILDLGQLNKQFDIIESAGVLHHMDNPMVGWKVLTDCLKPGGLMMIALYSELARQHIVRIREEISQLGFGSSDAEMRSFRDMIIKSAKNHHKQVLRFGDFYSLSDLRDLLFHVQEHRFTIPQLKERLNKLGLKFCGFETEKIVSHFKQTNTHQRDPYELDKWKSYEEANPRAFAGMYQFWCQKVD